MMLSLSLAALLISSSLAAIIYSLRKAPEGYEDSRGFHMIRKRVGVPGSKTTKTRRVAPREGRPRRAVAG
jgi:hypothetical protein